MAYGLCPAQPERARVLLSDAVGRVQSQVAPPHQHLVLVLDKVKGKGGGTVPWLWLQTVTLETCFPRTCKSCRGKAWPSSDLCQSPGCPPSTSCSATLSPRRWAVGSLETEGFKSWARKARASWTHLIANACPSGWSLISAEPRRGSTERLLRAKPSQQPVKHGGEISSQFQQVRVRAGCRVGKGAFAPESVVASHFCLLSPLPCLLHGICSEAGWKGVIGEVPSLEQVQAALTQHDLYM